MIDDKVQEALTVWQTSLCHWFLLAMADVNLTCSFVGTSVGPLECGPLHISLALSSVFLAVGKYTSSFIQVVCC